MIIFLRYGQGTSVECCLLVPVLVWSSHRHFAHAYNFWITSYWNEPRLILRVIIWHSLLFIHTCTSTVVLLALLARLCTGRTADPKNCFYQIFYFRKNTREIPIGFILSGPHPQNSGSHLYNLRFPPEKLSVELDIKEVQVCARVFDIKLLVKVTCFLP